jgi:hypothetical protein
MQRRAFSDSKEPVKKPFKVHVRPATYQLDTKEPFLIWNLTSKKWDTGTKEDLTNVKKTDSKKYNIVDTHKVLDYHTLEGSRKIRVFNAIKFNPDGSEFKVQFAQFLPDEPPSPPSLEEIEEAAKKQEKIEEKAVKKREEKAAKERADLEKPKSDKSKSAKPEPEPEPEPEPTEPEPTEPEPEPEPEALEEPRTQQAASSFSLRRIAARIAFDS